MAFKIKLPKSMNSEAETNVKKLIKFFGYKKISSNLKNNPNFPNPIDLINLYQLITFNKRINILEIGSGWSTMICYLALMKNKKNYSSYVKNNLKYSKPFQMISIDTDKFYLNKSKKNFHKFMKNKTKLSLKNIEFTYSQSQMTIVNGQYCTILSNLPKFNPDFIYLDGPWHMQTKNNKNFNFSNRNIDLQPMSADILLIEPFLRPGTILVVDGRGANSEFLKNNLKRKWNYKYLKATDQHIFSLVAKSWGIHSDKQLNFYK
ncbi:hypothetical protein MCEME18_00220 [Candidatus Pelagibacterales bacterium]